MLSRRFRTRCSRLLPSPDFHWTADDLVSGTPVRAAHSRHLRNAVDHLLSRSLQGGRSPTACGDSLARYFVGSPNISDFIDVRQKPPVEWTGEDLRIYRERLALEDRIREDCGFAL